MPNPRPQFLAQIASAILALPAAGIVRVAIDGVDGAGKTVFAEELAAALRPCGRQIIRASADSFHHPRFVRYRRGSASPEGFFRDSYDYPKLRSLLLDPLSQGGDGRYRIAAFDHRVDAALDAPEETAEPGAILLFDGLFLHRPELRGYWDFSIFLRVGFEISIPRGAQRGQSKGKG